MIHVLFSSSAAGTFRQLLGARGIAEGVVDLSEELDFGPISHGELSSREPWLNKHVPMDFSDYDWLAESDARFRTRIASDPERLIWIAPASASEQAGLYWYLSQFGGTNVNLAVADFSFGGTWNGKSPLTLGELGLERMGQLYDECPRRSWDKSRYSEDRWNALVAENALLRVVDDGYLISAPDDYFDKFLLAQCSNRWVKWLSVVGDTMGDIWETGQSTGSYLLLWRLRALIEDGKIACDGDPPRFGGSISDAVKIKRAG